MIEQHIANLQVKHRIVYTSPTGSNFCRACIFYHAIQSPLLLSSFEAISTSLANLTHNESSLFGGAITVFSGHL
jgi:hypothetical protein